MGAGFKFNDLKQLMPEFVSKGFEFYQSFSLRALFLTYIKQSDF
jgi:hypothetical protein